MKKIIILMMFLCLLIRCVPLDPSYYEDVVELSIYSNTIKDFPLIIKVKNIEANETKDIGKITVTDYEGRLNISLNINYTYVIIATSSKGYIYARSYKYVLDEDDKIVPGRLLSDPFNMNVNFNILNNIKDGDLHAVKSLIEAGIDINAKYDHGKTVLIIASNEGKVEIVKLLIELGADVNAKDNAGQSALFWASMYGHTDVVKLLIAAGAE